MSSTKPFREALDDARAVSPVLVKSLGDMEAWQRGELLFLVPVVPDAAPTALKMALAARRTATLHMVCSCGAVFTAESGRLEMAHEHGCIAHDDHIARLQRGWS